MTIHRGKVHKYLGMTLDYTEGCTVKVSMIYCIGSIIAAFNKEKQIGSEIKTRVAPEDLYKVDEDCDNLNPDKDKMFHNLVSKTLYTTNRESPYIPVHW